MDLIKKLDECENRLKEVQALIMDPDLVKDQKKYKDTMRENGYLTEVCALYDEYKKILQGIKDSTEMITMEDDVEMKEISGIDVAKHIREEQEKRGRDKSIIIFVTGYREYMEDAFEAANKLMTL